MSLSMFTVILLILSYISTCFTSYSPILSYLSNHVIYLNAIFVHHLIHVCAHYKTSPHLLPPPSTQMRPLGTYQTPHQLVMVTEPLDCGDLWSVIYETYPFNVCPVPFPSLIFLNGIHTLVLALTPIPARIPALPHAVAVALHMGATIYYLSIFILILSIL